MRVTLAASALIFALAAPAQAAAQGADDGANKQQWGTYESPGEMRLFYGVPDSGNVTVSFACEPKRNRIGIVTTVLPRKPRRGQQLRSMLSNGAVTATYSGKLGYTESEGYYFHMYTALEPKVVDVLKSGTSFTIGVPGTREHVPLRGAAEHVAKFEAACFGKR
jgi:hypothetical protein